MLLALLLGAGCYHGVDAHSGGGDGPTSGAGGGEPSGDSGAQPDPDEAAALGPIGIRRLSRHEFAATITLLTGVTLSDADLVVFPQDSLLPFDNDYEAQTASQALVDGVHTIAELVAERTLQDPALRDALLPCAPAGPDDSDCMTQFAAHFGRHALRRRLDDDEVVRFASAGLAAAADSGDFIAGADVVVRALLQDMEFLYRVELGPPHPDDNDLLQLDGYGLATRLSFLLWGTGPDDEILGRAEADEMATDEGLQRVATDMLADPRAAGRVARFVSMWLGYELPLPDETLDASMRRESAALVERVVFERSASLHGLFTSDSTFVDAALAEHYGLDAPDDPDGGWVAYGAGPRGGILSHATFLSNGVKAGDTSPTLRGLNIRNRLTCEEIPPPPPDAMVDADEPPQTEDPDACKPERYAVHSTDPGCASCHLQMDPVGFGLENYDAFGRFRDTEPDKPHCTIEGRGELAGVGGFQGPAELADALIESGRLDRCAVTQMFRFAMGRRERPAGADFIEKLTETFREGDHRFDRLLMAFIMDPGFRYRLIDQGGM